MKKLNARDSFNCGPGLPATTRYHTDLAQPRIVPILFYFPFRETIAASGKNFRVGPEQYSIGISDMIYDR